MTFLMNKYVFPFSICFFAIPFMAFGQTRSLAEDSMALNNAALSMKYFQQFYSVPPNKPQGDSIYWERTIILLNDEKILSKENLLLIDTKKIISIKKILNTDHDRKVDRILLLKTK